jgi:hypothetical protein
LKDSGGLDPWVDAIATTYHYNGWPEVAKLAIESAEQAGVLTHEEAQQYLSQLG